MKTPHELTLAKDMFLFRGLPREQADAFLSDERVYSRAFSAGQCISEPENFVACLGLVLSGGVRIERHGQGKSVPMGVMTAGQVFGAATLFGGSRYATRLTAKGKCRVLFFPQEAVEDILAASPTAALNYITFLSEKVRYLNARMDFYTAGGAKEKLLGYFSRMADADGFVPLKTSLSALAGQLDMGRASLYRAIEALEAEGAVEKREGGFRLIKTVKK